MRSELAMIIFFKWANPGLFFVYFWSYQTIQFLQQINVKMSIQYKVPGFQPMTFQTGDVTHNH